jgi:serine protease inhibitor
MVQGGSSVDSKNVRVDLSVPKFDVSDQIDLTEALPALGITDAFDWTVSDFTPLTTDLDEIYVSQALHGARLKIDEEGAEGAAYTFIKGDVGSTDPLDDRVELKLNRPFVFVLTNTDGLPLFVGIVHSPQ